MYLRPVLSPVCRSPQSPASYSVGYREVIGYQGHEESPIAEVGQRETRGGKATLAIAGRGPHTGIPETHDAVLAGARQIGEKTRMFVHPPSSRVIAEIREDRNRLIVEAPPLPSSLFYATYARIAKAHNAGLAVTRQVGDKTGMFVYAPPSRVVTEIGDHRQRVWLIVEPSASVIFV